MRGKLATNNVIPAGTRITPADAGKTSDEDAERFLEADHPRGCGENLTAPLSAYALSGSPPRMRGKLLLVFGFSFPFRITPADAGKTAYVLSFRAMR